MLTLLKKISGVIGEGSLFSGHPAIAPIDFERDWPDVEALLVREEWPFVREDLELSHAQPGGAAFVARKDGRFAGFFAAHAFGPIGYLDMMIIAPDFRRAGIGRPLYFATVNALKRAGARGFVVHTTNDSARLIRLLGFRPGRTFTLYRRDPSEPTGAADSDVSCLGRDDRDEIFGLDTFMFGRRRAAWIDGLLAQPAVQFFGLRRDGRVKAMVCLRPRRGDALCLDLVHATTGDDLACLVQAVVGRHADHTLECFARTGGRLEQVLRGRGFAVPAFFEAIGPLIEWRKGDTGRRAGASLETLSWF